MLRKLWNRIGRRAATTASRSRADRGVRLTLEPLEERRLLTMWAIFDTTIDPGDMKLDRDGEDRLFILGDESGDSMTIGVDGNDNVTVGGSDQIYRGWNDTTNVPNNLGTVAASSVRAIAADLGKGNDTLDLSAVTPAKFTGLVDGNIIISGGLGDDIITGSGFRDVISGDGGADTIHGGDGDDVIHGGDGDDEIYGDTGDDVLSGGDGNDIITAISGTDVVVGNGFKDGVDQGDLDHGDLDEASGMIIGRKINTKARIWTIEDSNNPTRLWVNDLNGDTRGYHPFDTSPKKVFNVDWEALAFYEDTEGKKWIYIGDIGNNNPNDDVTHTIYRTEEPATTDSQTGAQTTIANSAVERIVFDYPFGYDHDAETLMVDPILGDIYIVSKRERVTGEEGSLYKIAAGAAIWTVVTSDPPTVVEAEDLGEISTNTLAPSPENQNSRFAFSGGDISTDGKDVVLRTDRTVYQFHRDSTTGSENSIDELLTGTGFQPAQVIAAYERGNRESVAFNDAGDKIYTVSEHDANDSSLDNPNRWDQGDIVQEVLMYEAGTGSDTIITSAADLTRDGAVDFEDLTILLANWNQNVSAAEGNLVNPTTTPVNFEDLTVLLAAWTGPGGPGGSPSPEATTVWPPNGETAYSASIDVYVVFSEEVQGVDASDLELFGLGGSEASVGTPTHIINNIWKFPVSGLLPGAVDAVLAIDEDDITDMQDNSIEPKAWSFVVDPGLWLNEDGTGDVALAADFLGLSSTAVTVEVTFVSDEITSGTGAGTTIFAYATDYEQDAFTLFVENDSPNNMKLYVNGASLTLASGTDVTDLFDGVKYHLAVTYDSDTGKARAYVDGTAIGTERTFSSPTTVDDGSDNKGGTFFLGQEPDNETAPTFGFDTEQIFQGSILEVRIYDEVRTATEIESDMDNALNPASLPAELVHAWEFRGAGGLVSGLDITGNKHLELSSMGVGLLLNQGANTDDFGIVRSFSGFSSSELTIQFTFASDSITSVSFSPLIAYATSSSDNSLLLYVQQSESKMKLKINGSSSLTLAQDSDVFDLFDGAPHHVTLVYDGLDSKAPFAVSVLRAGLYALSA